MLVSVSVLVLVTVLESESVLVLTPDPASEREPLRLVPVLLPEPGLPLGSAPALKPKPRVTQ